MAKNIPPKEKLADKIMGDLFVEKTPVEPEARMVPRRKVKEAQKERLQMTIQPRRASSTPNMEISWLLTGCWRMQTSI